MTFPKHVKIVEVSPRDGLQNETTVIPTAIKLKYIDALAKSGLSIIETTSFVSPKWVPQMADHAELMTALKRKTQVQYPVLIPNEKGLHTALAAGVKDIAVFTAASETFSQKNTHCSVAESLERITKVIEIAKQHHLSIRGYVSTVLGCPYEGDIKPKQVALVAKDLFELGCKEISLGDTIGVGTPFKTLKLLETVAKEIPVEKLAVHFHDTYGQALANIYASLSFGIATIDSSAAGLGGCPYAPGASGNVATEDVIYMLNGMDIETGVDLDKLLAATKIILTALNRPTRSKVAQAFSKP